MSRPLLAATHIHAITKTASSTQRALPPRPLGGGSRLLFLMLSCMVSDSPQSTPDLSCRLACTRALRNEVKILSIVQPNMKRFTSLQWNSVYLYLADAR